MAAIKNPRIGRKPVPTIREIIKRDIGVKIEGVVKVFDHASLATEIREYVVTDKIEARAQADLRYLHPRQRDAAAWWSHP